MREDFNMSDGDDEYKSDTLSPLTVRYAIDDDLWESFTFEQVRKQIGRLHETGRFRKPNNGGPFVVRVSQYALSGDEQYIDKIFYDFSFEGDALTDITVVTWAQRSGSLHWKTRQRKDEEIATAVAMWDEAVVQIWWERDYICVRTQVPESECEKCQEIAWMAANVVVILLQDRNANKVVVEPKRRSKLKLKFIQRRPQIPNNENVTEILLTIPRRVYTKTSDGEASKAHRPHRMHYRAEHVRQQPYGPRSAPSYREKVIAGMWINASDVPPAERGTPMRLYRFTEVG